MSILIDFKNIFIFIYFSNSVENCALVYSKLGNLLVYKVLIRIHRTSVTLFVVSFSSIELLVPPSLLSVFLPAFVPASLANLPLSFPSHLSYLTSLPLFLPSCLIERSPSYLPLRLPSFPHFPVFLPTRPSYLTSLLSSYISLLLCLSFPLPPSLAAFLSHLPLFLPTCLSYLISLLLFMPSYPT